MKTLRRTIYPVAKVIDAKAGLVEYVASDESLDSYREVVRVKGWKFDMLRKNFPFVDSHNYESVERLLGSGVDFKVDRVGGKPALVETVKWAVDVAENKLAQLGFRMTQEGHLKAVSVGFWPVKAVSKWDADPTAYQAQLMELGLGGENAPRVIYTEQQQIELSACIIGANPNALAKAYKAGVISDEELAYLDDQARKNLSLEESELETARPATVPADAGLAQQRASLELMATVVRIAGAM